MLIQRLNLNGNILEFYNSFFGKEAVYYNGKKIEEKFSFAGGDYRFKVEEDGEQVEYRVKLSMKFNTAGIYAMPEVYRNNVAILST